METRQKIAQLLDENSGEFLSGSRLATALGITRSAVWKNIRLLEEDGYRIEAVPNRGYRLSEENDALSAAGIRKYLGESAGYFSLELYRSIDSTNNILKTRVETLPDWFTVIAEQQTAGRGRMGRTFYSPAGCGIYLSTLLHPVLPAKKSVRITAASAVAACRAIEDCTGRQAEIKWVNDVFLNGRKVCGILTEGALNLETDGLDWAVMGIGMNVYEPEESYPEALREIAGAIAEKRENNLRCRLAASFLLHFHRLCSELESGRFAEEYRERNFLIGRQVLVIRGGEERAATALDVDRECRLSVRYEDGSREALSSGEVRIRAQRDGGI